MSSQLKGNSRIESDSEEERNKKKEDKIDLKLPFDMKTFWKNTNEKYFRKLDQFSINEVNHLVHLYSKFDTHNDQIYTKFGFPRTLNCLVGKAQEIMSRKSNPLQVSKFFGMYVYIDKFDYLVNNLNNEEIDEEIDLISNKLGQIEENNLYFFKHLEDRIKSTAGKIDLTSEKVFQNRFDNLTNQIFTLQMKQFAESIWNIKKDIKKNKYLLMFDQSEGIESLSLDEPEYKELLKYRDPMNSVSVYDLFQEKIYSYYNTGSNASSSQSPESKAEPREKKKRGRKPKKIKQDNELKVDGIESTSQSTHEQKKRGRKRKVVGKPVGKVGRKRKQIERDVITKQGNNRNIKMRSPYKKKKKKEQVEIAKVVSINYDFCHHCKQRKPAEVMVRCNSSNCHKFVERPLKNFYVNNTTCVRKFKNFIITNFSGDPKEILDGYLNKKIQQNCKRSFCNFCLKGSYDQIIDQIKDKKDWICPWCMGICFCSRCIRYDQILKLISLYISYNGDINILYDNLINKSIVLDKLSVSLLISNIIIIKNDPINKSNKLIKSYTGKRDYEAIDHLIDQCYKYRDKVTDLKDYFDKVFNKARHEKVILNMDKKMTTLCLQNSIEKSQMMLGKKKKRDEESDQVLDVAGEHFREKLGDDVLQDEASSMEDYGQYDEEESSQSNESVKSFKKAQGKRIGVGRPPKNKFKKQVGYTRLIKSLV